MFRPILSFKLLTLCGSIGWLDQGLVGDLEGKFQNS